MKYLFLIIFVLISSLNADFKRNNRVNTVIDINNALMWVDDKSVLKIRKTHEEAIKYCESLKYAGYSNWRIPTIEEFTLIVDKKNEKNYINRAFKYNLADGYWAKKAHWRTFWYYADYMHFISGTPYFDSRHKKKYVRCVRDMK